MEGVVGMILRLLADVDLGIGILSICIAAACFCCSFVKAAAAWAMAAVCAAVNPGNAPPNPRLGLLAATAWKAAAICAMLFAFTAEDAAFPPLNAAVNVF